MTGPQIQHARRKLGLSRVELAERLGVSVYTVRSWELGQRTPCCRWMREALDRALSARRIE